MRFFPRAFGAVFLSTILVAVAAAATGRSNFTDHELIDGFSRTVFGAESGGSFIDRRRVKKYTDPVYVRIYNTASRDRTAEVIRFIGMLDKSINNLRIRTTRSDAKANMVVFLVERRRYRQVIQETLLAWGQDTRFLEMNDCSAVADAPNYEMQQALVYIVVDEGRHAFRHCMIEEILQSLGPVNDDWRLKYSIFNDYNNFDKFGVFDWYLLNMLYDRRIKPGMSEFEARKVLPTVIADARKRLRRAMPLLRSQ
ncbi:MAG: DUF2927 domain-containing protein [Hyphomicrobiales bacterium]|nr:DUF2927 domain-containing protein [Hyphomicrobiales bacterium]